MKTRRTTVGNDNTRNGRTLGSPQHKITELFQQHYDDLLRHVRRHIRHDEFVGDLPMGALDARDIVDEVARHAAVKADQKPANMNWPVWFFHLAHEELRRQRRLLKDKQATEISTDETKDLPEDAERAAGYTALRPLDIIQEELDPPKVRTESLVPDPTAAPPDRIVQTKDLLEYLQSSVQNWRRPQRDVFELYFVEGFEPREIAVITGQPLKKVQETINSIHRWLREQLLQRQPIISV